MLFEGMMKKMLFETFPRILHGGDYNPEQWIDTKEIWDEDMRLATLARANTFSVGIFSWSKLEPREGEYDFSFLDEIIEKIYKNGGRVFLATPSGARPRWMAEKYPEVLRVDNTGHRDYFGRRHNHCPSSPVYREKVRAINERLSQRYGNHPAVLGFHISNELGGECFCNLCIERFRSFLKKKYDTDIDKLNFEWWTTFWSHTYDSFEQIEPPYQSGDNFASLILDFRRFTTENTRDFLHMEVEALRKYSDKPTTTNFMTCYTALDYQELSKEIDFISWDSYPDWHLGDEESEFEVANYTAFNHDYFRAMKRQPFILMESTPSSTNWKKINKLKKPGMHRLASIQAVAHGSDSVMYFQWRKSRGSNEKLHGAVVDHTADEHTRTFREVAELGGILDKLSCVVGTMPRVKCALVFDAENRWALECCEGFENDGDKRYLDVCMNFHRAFFKRGIAVDVISRDSDISSYDLVVLPMLYSVSEKNIQKYTNFVQNGGTLVATYMLGMANENDLCYLGGFPALSLKNVFGIWAEEADTLSRNESNKTTLFGERYSLFDICEVVHAKGAEVLSTYESDFYQGMPVVTKNNFGKGKAYYIAARDRGDLATALIDKICSELNITSPLKDISDGVSVCEREGDGERYLFLQNFNTHPISLYIEDEKFSVLRDKFVSGEIELPAYGIEILRDKCK